MAFAENSEIDMVPVTSAESVETPDPSANRFMKHPGYPTLVRRAIQGLNSKSGSSFKSILNYILKHYMVKKATVKAQVRKTLVKMEKDKRVYKQKNGRYKLTPKGRKTRGGKRRRKGGKKGKKSKKGRRGKKRRKGRKKKGRKGRKGRRGKRGRKGGKRRK